MVKRWTCHPLYHLRRIPLKTLIAHNSSDMCFCLYLIERIMDEYEQDLRVLEENHQQGLQKLY